MKFKWKGLEKNNFAEGEIEAEEKEDESDDDDKKRYYVKKNNSDAEGYLAGHDANERITLEKRFVVRGIL